MTSTGERTLIGWGKRVSYTILDQGFFSGANFIVSLLLAHFISVSAYGVFSITYSIFLFVAGIYSSLVLEPINVLGPKNHDNDLLLYKKQAIKFHFIIAGIIAFLGLVFTLILFLLRVQSDYVQMAFFISISFPFTLFFWLARQCAYLETKPKIAFLGSFVYAIIYVGNFLVLTNTHKAQVSSVFIIMAIASTFSGLLVFYLIGIKHSNYSLRNLIQTPSIFKENWAFGKWILFASIANGISSLMYSPLIGFALSVEMAAVFRGMQNFFLPFTQVVTALSLLITPYLSRIRFTSTNKKFKNSIYCLLLISLLISVIYSVLIVIFGNTICKVVYNNVIYLQNTWIIPYIAFSTILITLNSALGVLFRVIEKPNIVLYEKIIAAIAVFLISIPLVILLKMKGALIGLNISLLIELITLLVFGYFQLRQRKLHEEIFPKNSKAFFSD